MPNPHFLPREYFDALADGGGGARAVGYLRTTNRSRHLALLRIVLDQAAARPEAQGPLAHPDTVWTLLTATHEEHPDAVEPILRHPVVGIWGEYALRRLRRSVGGEEPLWGVVGYLGCMTASAMVRAGLPFTIRVPVADGCVVLPTVGMAQLPGSSRPWDVATVSSRHRRLRIRGTANTVDVSDHRVDSTGWIPARQMRASTDQAHLDVLVDDLDRYRGFSRPAPPAPLDAAAVEDWRSRIAETWALLVRHHRLAAEEIAAGLTVLVPAAAHGPLQPYSASSTKAFGCVALSSPRTNTDFAVTLVHEFQHSKLAALLELVSLFDPDAAASRFYAPWRDDPRPLAGLLQGAYSFLGVAGFWRTQRSVDGEPIAHFEFTYWREQTRRTVLAMCRSGALTHLGRRFVTTMARRLTSWCAEPVPQHLLSLARLTATDHHGTWRLRYLRPDSGLVAAMTEAWLAGRPRTAGNEPEPSLREDAEVPDEPLPRPTLVRTKLADPPLFESIRADPARLPGTTAPDLDLVAGDISSAIRGYLDLIREDRHRAGPWTGLGHALSRSAGKDRAPAGAVLLHRPELVRAIAGNVVLMSGSAPDIVRLAAWLGTGGADTRPHR